MLNRNLSRLRLDSDEAAFLAEFREWLESELAQPYLDRLAERSATEFFGVEPEFSRRLGQAGYLGITTSAEFGGAGRSHLEQALLQAEMAWQRAPILGHFVAEREVIPALIRFGTDEQRRRLLPELLSGRALCSQAFTEPGAGSDLASISTRAERGEQGYVIDGEKWLNSVAHVAGYIWLIARTGGGERHRGLSMFLVPAGAAGISVEGLPEMTGITRLNRIRFDRVEVGAECLVGEIDRGWQIAMDTVARERAGAARPAGMRRIASELAQAPRDGLGEADGRLSAAQTELIRELVRIEAAELLWLDYARAGDTAGGQAPEVAGTTLKVLADEIEHDLAALAVDQLGRAGVADIDGEAAHGGRLARLYLAAPGFHLGGGASEVLRMVVATRGLGLPREGGKR